MKIIKIEAYAYPEQFKKSGVLKKKAQACFAISETVFNNDQKSYSTDKIAMQLKDQGYHSFKSPYMFTHISCQDSTGKEIRVFETVNIDGHDFITSPVELLKNLNS
jgi:hypothetical protein